MGRWTPLILMAGGLAILLGTLLGISFPMGGQNAQAPTQNPGKASKVLPANINVNSTANGNNAPTNQEAGSVAQTTQNDTNTNSNQTTPEPTATETPTTETNQNNEPIRALW
ncbi:hypothetical protein [Iningainema tapete]|uniref:Uncharacterized protein n=1 Tax=Iningainema tapete BLCC-T55 TaxID=2748662 RepID=A0A8J6XHU3_9CYAN|nr:hypothetical protein [Iningainema tapete]MBD2771829.1 hypothetical protein [Iningainema tapete BLCC-T55]